MTTTNDFDTNDAIATQLRRTLHAVADTVTDNLPETLPTAPRSAKPRRRRHRLAITVASVAGLAACGVVAWQQLGPGEIERIPTEDALIEGTTQDGTNWWLIPSADVHPEVFTPPCNPPSASVELVSGAANKPGDEWNTGGVTYGEPLAPNESNRNGLCPDEASWLANPARFNMGSTRLGDNDDPNSDLGCFATVHPTVTQIRVTADDHRPFTVNTGALPERPDGPRFAAFTVPPNTHAVKLQLLTADGTTVIEWTHTP